MCGACSANGAEQRCPTCRAKDATAEFPFDETSKFTELFNHVVESFKRDPTTILVATIICFGLVFAGNIVGSIVSNIINAILGFDANDASKLKDNPMLLVGAFAVSYLVSLGIQTLVQAVGHGALYRLLIDVVTGRKTDVSRMFSQMKDAPKYVLLQGAIFLLSFGGSLVLIAGGVAVVLRTIGFDWSHPASTRPEALFAPMPLAIFLAVLLVMLGFIVVLLPISVFALPELVVSDCTPMEAIRRANRLGDGQRLRMFGYSLLASLLLLAGLAACCVGLLVTYPVVYMLWATLFLSLRKNSGLPPPDYT